MRLGKRNPDTRENPRVHSGSIKEFAERNRLRVNDKKLADVSKAVTEIRRDSFGPLHIEYALLVTRTGLTFVSGTSEDVTYTLSPDIIAVIHTHPDKGHERPSVQDVKTAHDTGVPVYVVSRDQVWVALPTGEVLSERAKENIK